MIRANKIVAGLSLASTFIFNATTLMASEVFSPYVDANGKISLPDDFRTSMVHLGSWFVPEGSASGFHDVYTEKASVEAYRRTDF
jgi:hypothetical protein